MLMNSIRIGSREIGPGHPPFVIAELSANHNGSLERAIRLVEAAVEAGADAVKLQTYRPDTITLQSDSEDFRINDGLWAGRTLYELYEWAHMPWEWHETLFRRAESLGITIFSSPFDNTAADFLSSLSVPAFKIASFEAVDLPLVTHVASLGMPMLISTGMADVSEIQDAVDAARLGGCNQLVLLRCVSGYPAPAGDYNLQTMVDMKRRFGCLVGLSDHTIDNATALAAVALGACVVEKHFTLDRTGGGPDDSFSLEPAELKELCVGVRRVWEALGQVDYGRKSSERANAKFRRSLYWVRDLESGELVTRDSVRSVRPGFGLAPKRLAEILGRAVRRPVRANTPTRDEDFLGEDA